MIKAVIFDFFGVIITTDPYKEWLQQHIADIRTRKAEFQGISDRGDRGEITFDQFIDEVAQKAGVSREETLRMNEETYPNYPLIDYIKELRQQGYKIGIISNTTEDWIYFLLSLHGLYEYFDQITVSSTLGVIKPQPGIFTHTLSALGVAPHEAVYTDDREVHVQAARSLKIHSFLFKDAAQFRKQLLSVQS